MMKRSTPILLIMTAAVAFRIIFAWSAPPPRKDALEYTTLALNLADGLGFCYEPERPAAFRPPLYPVVLAALFKLTDNAGRVAGFLDAALGGLTCLLIYLIGRRFMTDRAALAAGALWAVNPLALDSPFGAGTSNTETLVSFLLLSALAAVHFAAASSRLAWAVASGVLLGLLALLKSAMLLLPAILFVVFLACAIKERSGRRAAAGLIMLAAAGACILPWTYRNYKAFGSLVPVSTNGGITFFRSNNPTSDGGHTYPAGALQRYDHLDEVERSRRFYRDGWAFLRENPERVPWLAYRKTRMLLDPLYSSRTFGGSLVYNVWYAALLPFALLGFARIASADRWWTMIAVAALLELWLVTLLFHGYPRYRFPCETLLVLWVPPGLALVSERIRSGLWRAVGTGLYLTGHLVLCFVLPGLVAGH